MIPGAPNARALVRRDTIASACANAIVSIGFFLLVFGWGPVAGRSLAFDFPVQTFGITFLGGIVPSFIMLARVRKGIVSPLGPVPSAARQIWRLFGLALAVMPMLGGAAALLMLAFGPAAISPQAALIVKSLYGGLVSVVTTPLILRSAMGGAAWRKRVSRELAGQGDARNT
ncbi:hypothetical protein ASG11_10900 [Sphingomonas sp. Leaf357]|uniref:hypothetical protein n=1 Tax=Sphingomonas sp. Leaf357 TaxID=1736350 RepID=UPI0006FDF55F|nr:hypothetical protein [Sphingomonas sp. Leaf357]KQS04693.1 hypothetical protein ASG11_10900 [Sphingomonas sp. Leaf357]